MIFFSYRSIRKALADLITDLHNSNKKIARAKVVEINELRGKKSEKDVAYYVVGNYVSKQPVERMSYSHKLVCVGFCKKWKIFLEIYGKRAIEVWDKWLCRTNFHKYVDTKITAFVVHV